MNIGILTLIDFADLTVAVLLTHLFVFDRRWLPPAKANQLHPVVFFDGVCNLCNGAVDAILAEDHEGRFHFAPLQGTTAEVIDSELVKAGKSMACQDGAALYVQSDAVLHIAAGLGGLWRMLAVVKWLPRPLRDGAYHLMQAHRYRLFGKRQTCRLPTAEQAARFLP